MGPNPPVDDAVVTGPLTAFKAARLVVGRAGLCFAGVGMGGVYGPADTAVCVSVPQHVPPATGCGCGFYAWKDRGDAANLIDGSTAVLEVELFGRFHEYDRGYIAAAQLVRTVTLQPYCVACLFRRDGGRRTAIALRGRAGSVHGQELVPVCDEHLGSSGESVTLRRVADEFGVEVRWAADDDQIVEVAKELDLTLRPRLAPVRRLDDLLPAETGYVFHNSIAEDSDGSLWIDPLARLIQPLPGTDIPVWLDEDGTHVLGLDALTRFDGWRHRTDPRRLALPVSTFGTPSYAEGTDDETQDRAA